MKHFREIKREEIITKKLFVNMISKRDLKEIIINLDLEVITPDDLKDTVYEMQDKLYYIKGIR